MESPAPRSLCSSASSLHSAVGDSDMEAHAVRPSAPSRPETPRAVPLSAESEPKRRSLSFSAFERPSAMDTDAQTTKAPIRRPRSPEEDTEAKRVKLSAPAGGTWAWKVGLIPKTGPPKTIAQPNTVGDSAPATLMAAANPGHHNQKAKKNRRHRNKRAATAETARSLRNQSGRGGAEEGP
ncbi:unnamed protein product [Arctia plantaginis]|uniref:Uncharacterized protein n=1 Tax=Arctia plantaginis TaxID=874455 RepID=A0A8S0ZFA7_ARCPL|nr:unnamed protein product [Arctia plantaginis]